MYRSSAEYDRITQLVTDIYLDYNIKSFPLDIDGLIRKMKINLVPYSAYPDEVELLMKKSRDAFFIPRSEKIEATILFNDQYGSHLTKARINSSKGHELKHILENDKDDSEDDLCDFFSKYLRCPIPWVIYLEINTTIELISYFGISNEQAVYVLKNIKNRKNKYGLGFFKKEIPLLEQILGDKFNINDIEIID